MGPACTGFSIAGPVLLCAYVWIHPKWHCVHGINFIRSRGLILYTTKIFS